MGKYSRTAKYQELRDQLQNDPEGQIDTKELSQFTDRLSKIDSSRLGTRPSHEPILMENEYLDRINKHDDKIEVTTFNNEYLDEYIQEVKQYNRDKGIMFNDDTQINILQELRGNPHEEIKLHNHTKAGGAKKHEPVLEETTDIPFLQQDTQMNTQISIELSKMLNEEEVVDQPKKAYVYEDDYSDYDDDEEEEEVALPFKFRRKLKEEKEEREKLMEETSRMKVQLDNYRGNLDQMEERVNNSNRILNFVLVVLIFALLVVIGVVGYWLLLTRGII